MSNGNINVEARSRVDSPRTGEFGFADVCNLLLRHWPLLLLFTSLGMSLSVLYWYLTPRVYESATQILVMRKDQSLGTGYQGTTGTESKVSEDLLSTHIQIIQSNRIIEEALEEDGLDQLPSIQQELSEKMTAVEYVAKRMAVTRGGSGMAKNAHVLNIKFRHGSDIDAQRVLTAMTNRYQEFLLEKFQDVNEEAAGLITKARQELEEELVAAEKRFLESRQNAPLLWAGATATNVPRMRFESIQSELSDLEVKHSQVNARLEVVEAMAQELKASGARGLEWLALIDEKDATRFGAFATVFQGETATAAFQSLQPSRATRAATEASELLKLMVKEKTLSQDFGPNHPEVKATREQIVVIRDFLRQSDLKTRVNGDDLVAELDPETIALSYIKLLRHDGKSLDGLIKNLTAQAKTEEAAAKELINYEMEDETIRKEVERKQALYDIVVNRLRDINLARDFGGFINEVISPPKVGKEVWPKLSICLLLGIMCGLMVGGASASLVEFRDRSFRDPSDVATTLGLPVLSHMPDLLLNSKKGNRTSPVCATLCTVHRPKSRDAEVFRSLRTALFSKCNAEKFKVVGCSSSVQGDGKSTMLSNLAVAIAQAGRRVLLIDCDLRRPSQHVQFALENKQGVTSILNDEVEVLDAILETSVNGLSFLPAGPSVANPAETLDSTRFGQLLELVRDRYDFILVDMPPVLAVSDPCIVAPQLDLMLLVIRVSRDSRPQAMQAKAMLVDVGAHVLGTIINGCDAPAHFFGSYGDGKGYGYHAGSDGKSSGYYHDENVETTKPQKQSQPDRVNGTHQDVEKNVVEARMVSHHSDDR